MRDVVDVALEEDVSALGALMVRLSWVGRRKLEQELNGYGLTVPQYMALRCVREHEHGCTMSQLAESSDQVPATMTGVIDRLAERELVRRERDPHDRRAQRVVMTPAGEALLWQITEAKRTWIRQFAVTLSPEERRTMINLAQGYLAAIEETVVVK